VIIKRSTTDEGIVPNILINDMLDVVFDNPFSNGFIFCGPYIIIEVSARDAGERVPEISVTAGREFPTR
jgi:hypothetical protein